MAKGAILQTIADALDISVSKLEDQAGVTRGRLGKAIERNSDLTFEVVESILAAFPQLRREYFLKAEGSPLKEEGKQLQPGNIHETDIPYAGLTKLSPMTMEEMQVLADTGDWNQAREIVAQRITQGNLVDFLTELYLRTHPGK